MQQVALNNGLAMPLLGFGLFQITDALHKAANPKRSF
jgi:diketogulonate reductase-like aldo/keto reductase